MHEFETAITEKGQVTIPQEIRRKMGLQPRDKVRFEIVNDVVQLKRASSKLLSGFGAVSPVAGTDKPEGLQAERDAFEKGVAREVVSEA